jgi:hypothetical protein
MFFLCLIFNEKMNHIQLIKLLSGNEQFIQKKCVQTDQESQDYKACTYQLNGLKIIGRTAKITPTKIGQFVTLWKRLNNGPIQPFDCTDDFEFVIINAKTKEYYGQFVFPKEILIKQSIITNGQKEGKRAIRVYPSWDNPTSKQAIKTQNWQLKYFILSKNRIDSF